MGGYAAAAGHIRPPTVDPVGYATEFAQLRAFGDRQKLAQQEMELRQQAEARAQQEAAQAQQINQLKIDQTNRSIAQTQAVNDAYREASEQDENGNYRINRAKLQQALAQKGHGAAFAGELQHLDEYDRSQQALQEHRFKLQDLQADHGGAIGAAVKAEGYDPRLFLTYAQQGLRDQTISRQNAQPAIEAVMRSLQIDPSGAQARALVQHYSDNLIAASPNQQKVAKEAAALKAQEVTTAGQQQVNEQRQRELEATNALLANPEKMNLMISGSIDPKRYPDQFRRTQNDAMNALRLGQGVKGVQTAIKDGSDRIAARENAEAQAAITTIPARENAAENRAFQHGQQSYNTAVRELDQINKPVDDAVARFGRLQATLNQNSRQADALVAPELLTVMAGGTGSGLRMSEAEIARVIGGRTKWEELKSAINAWQIDPSKATSIPTEQRKEIRALMDEVGKKLTARASLMNDARNSLANTNDPMAHRKIMVDLHKKLTELDTAGEASSSSRPPLSSFEH